MTNISDLMRLGHEVRLFTRISPYTTLDDCLKFYRKQGIDVRLIPWQTRKMLRYRIRDVAFVNGVSWEFGKPDFLDGLAQELTAWTPDVVWCHTGYAWPAAAFVKKRGVPAIIRSIDYVPINYALRNQRDRKLSLPLKLLRYWGVLLSEYRSLQNAAVHVAITPVEQKLYQNLRPKSNVQVLPLRVLPQLVRKEPRQVTNRRPLRVYFMATKYTAKHNLVALKFILEEIIPRVRQRCAGAFEFHILGQRVPPEMLTQAASDVIFDGYVPDLDAHLANMDIALVPSVVGVGMQQKVFESLCRGFPTLTYARGLSGFRFEHGKNILLEEDADGFVDQLSSLQDSAFRETIGANALRRCAELFSQGNFDRRLSDILQAAVNPALKASSTSIWTFNEN
ncbi:MAG TPA: glycosyltransferase [Aggregatilineales bacterium]|nr:glycosyltransferase [Aggregatilineales bacterium]